MSERRLARDGPRPPFFVIEVDDGDGFRAATAAEVDAALRQRELFGAADYLVQRDDAAEPPARLVAGYGRAVRGRVAVGWPAAAVGLVGVPVAGSGGPRGARLCSVRRRRPVAGLRHAGCQCR